MKYLLLLNLFLTSLALANSSKYEDSKEYKLCMDNSNGVTISMRECNSKEIERLESVLQDTISETISKIEPGIDNKKEFEKDFVESQKLWGKYINKYCGLHLYSGGTMSLIIYDSCLIESMDAKINELRKLEISS